MKECSKMENCLFYTKYQKADQPKYNNLINEFCKGGHEEQCQRHECSDHSGLVNVDGFGKTNRYSYKKPVKMEYQEWDYRRR